MQPVLPERVQVQQGKGGPHGGCGWNGWTTWGYWRRCARKLAWPSSPRPRALSAAHLHARGGTEHLVGGIELAAIAASLDHRDVVFLGQLNNGGAGDSNQYVVADRGRYQGAVLHQEEVAGASLGNVTIVREHDRFIV